MGNRHGLIEKILSKPHIIISFLALFLMSGIVGYKNVDRNLFPNSNYPEVAVVVSEPGASAKSIAANVSVPIEEELYTLDEIRRVYSTTIDGVTVVKAEFEYSKDIDTAVMDVSNAVDRVASILPSDIVKPRIIRITEATAPIMVIALSPDKESGMDLEDIRDLASGDIRHRLLKIEGVANVEVFGGYKKELQIILDKDKLDSYGLTLGGVIATIGADDEDYAIGLVQNGKKSYLLSSYGRAESVEALKNLEISPTVKLGDIADITFSHYDNTASYFGNGKEAIALSVQRSLKADVIGTADRVEKLLEKLKKRYPSIHFEISDTQRDTIDQSIDNMFESLRDAIVMSTIIVFLFLASFRQILVVLVTIPLVYASTIALMWLCSIEFNVVTLTAIILALGLLLDDTVVVMENIERHYRELGKPIARAVIEGTKEIMFADLSGTVTTMVALAPMLFVGGYPQTVFAPLVGTLLLALLSSYIISIVAVPLLSLKILSMEYGWLLKIEDIFNSFVSRVNDSVQRFFSSIVDMVTGSKVAGLLSVVLLLALFGISVKKVMPLVGQELMPPMDTGAVNIKITTDSNLPIEASEELMKRVYEIVSSESNLTMLSGSIGSEPGVLSIGTGGGVDRLSIVATYIDRFHRDRDIWRISADLREKISSLEHVKYLEVSPYGATAMSSIRANVDTLLGSEDIASLPKVAKDVESALAKTKGVVSTSVTWDMDKVVYELDIDRSKALQYGLSSRDIVSRIGMMLRGVPVATFPKKNSTDYTVRVWMPSKDIDDISSILSLLVDTKKGKVPLSYFATIVPVKEPGLITREGLKYTIEVYGSREKAAISHIMADYREHLKEVSLPSNVDMEQIGDENQFKSSAGRMVRGVATAVGLIFLTLIVMFGDLKVSAIVVFSIPLTIIGASWTLLYMGYHVSMPAMMGFILLSGIIVNNAILLIHFALTRIAEGIPKKDAMLESIRIRTRPVLMTAFSVSAGMLPVAQGAAIGLERLAPLGSVVIGGLIVGTLMTLVFIPVIFIWSVNEKRVVENMTP